MKKTLRKIALAGLSVVALAGCGGQERIKGEFRGNKVIIDQTKNTSILYMVHPVYGRIVGYDFGRNGIFDRIALNGTSLVSYANSDSLKVAYDSVIAQNSRGGTR